jgi:hypothetical protein
MTAKVECQPGSSESRVQRCTGDDNDIVKIATALEADQMLQTRLAKLFRSDRPGSRGEKDVGRHQKWQAKQSGDRGSMADCVPLQNAGRLLKHA